MASDYQRTGRFREYARKVRIIRPTELLGCAGAPEYSNVFTHYVVRSLEKNGRKDYEESLNRAINSYSRYASDSIDKLKLQRIPYFDISDLYPEAIFAAYDKASRTHRTFEIHTPKPCLEVFSPPQNRLAVGSGGTPATVFMKTIEKVFSRAHITDSWRNFSPKTLGQFCYVMIARIGEIDPYSGGVEILTLTDKVKQFTPPSGDNPLFPDASKTYLAQLVGSVISDLGEEKVKQIAKAYRLRELMPGLGSLFG
jgi:hypothetical protein